MSESSGRVVAGEGWAEREVFLDSDPIGYFDYDEPGSGRPFFEPGEALPCLFAEQLRAIADFLDRQEIP